MTSSNTCEHRPFIILGFVVVTVLCMLPAHTALAQTQTDTTIHIVAWGETVSSIASRYGVTVDAIVAANHLTEVDRIYAGQQLVIPYASGSGSASDSIQTTHTVRPGENLYRISLAYGISVQALVTANALPDENHVYAGQILVIPQPGTGGSGEIAVTVDTNIANSHIVQAGETLSGISQMYGVSMSALEAANGILNPSRIFTGQSLIIPGAANTTNLGYTPKQASVTHVIESGETLFSIATHYSVSMWVIAQTNHISNPSLIYPGQTLSIPVSGALNPVGENAGAPGKSIVVDVSDQRVYAYEDGVVIQTLVASTGIPGQDTRRGSFQIQNKIPMAYAATWDIQMPYWLGFYWAGPLQNGFHALPILSNGLRLWEGLLGRPASYGCVILGDESAQWLYGWSDIGTSVTVQD